MIHDKCLICTMACSVLYLRSDSLALQNQEVALYFIYLIPPHITSSQPLSQSIFLSAEFTYNRTRMTQHRSKSCKGPRKR